MSDSDNIMKLKCDACGHLVKVPVEFRQGLLYAPYIAYSRECPECKKGKLHEVDGYNL